MRKVYYNRSRQSNYSGSSFKHKKNICLKNALLKLISRVFRLTRYRERLR